jgi:hypothetical protein
MCRTRAVNYGKIGRNSYPGTAGEGARPYVYTVEVGDDSGAKSVVLGGGAVDEWRGGRVG